MTICIAEPLGRKDLRRYAEVIRRLEGCTNKMYFDIVHFLENTLPKIDASFSFTIEPIEKMGECHGLTYPDRNEIKIREDVYLRACEDEGRDRLTMAHELFHLLQHESSNISFARTGNGKVEAFRDPEWQANAFGGELLVPHDLVAGMTVDEVMDACKVSRSAAVCQLSKS